MMRCSFPGHVHSSCSLPICILFVAKYLSYMQNTPAQARVICYKEMYSQLWQWQRKLWHKLHVETFTIAYLVASILYHHHHLHHHHHRHHLCIPVTYRSTLWRLVSKFHSYLTPNWSALICSTELIIQQPENAVATIQLPALELFA